MNTNRPTCPYCGEAMAVVQRGVSGALECYLCPSHGRFWLDDKGHLQEELRSPNRPKSVK
jgi:Zn-finger nucleic acid-binding protein